LINFKLTKIISIISVDENESLLAMKK